MLKIEEENIQWLMENYGIGVQSGQYIVGVDEHTELGGADLVIYDVQELDLVYNMKDLSAWCDENGGDEESFEADRVCLIKNKNIKDNY